ncbi:MAG: hypothetical protein KGK03_03040 [Candidatus Omnitrophica bacterium]|nr:hypothetical protein [Candidatus Omnitrophota bacterium]MDE2222027.1 hypothetical protein [Candidatus Omnitrophota bacterium]
MLIRKAFLFCLLAAAFLPLRAYSQESLMTVFGTVVSMDIESGELNVKTDKGLMVFYISTESKLLQFTHAMSSLEIANGDPVEIQYTSAEGKNTVMKLVDTNQDINLKSMKSGSIW